MKITGAAPKIAVPTFLYMLLVIFIHYKTYPMFRITQDPSFLTVLAIIMILIGALFVIMAAVKLQRSFRKGILMTDGLYKYVRNPMYDAYLVFVIPGICLLFNSWLVLSTVIINFILLQVFIREEYAYLENKFGDQYQQYLKRVKIKLI